jgi:hypothetical protein
VKTQTNKKTNEKMFSIKIPQNHHKQKNLFSNKHPKTVWKKVVKDIWPWAASHAVSEQSVKRITLPASSRVSWRAAKLEAGIFAVEMTIHVDSVETLTILGNLNTFYYFNRLKLPSEEVLTAFSWPSTIFS